MADADTDPFGDPDPDFDPWADLEGVLETGEGDLVSPDPEGLVPEEAATPQASEPFDGWQAAPQEDPFPEGMLVMPEGIVREEAPPPDVPELAGQPEPVHPFVSAFGESETVAELSADPAADSADPAADADVMGFLFGDDESASPLPAGDDGFADHGLSDHAVSDHAVSDHAVSDHAVSDHAVEDATGGIASDGDAGEAFFGDDAGMDSFQDLLGEGDPFQPDASLSDESEPSPAFVPETSDSDGPGVEEAALVAVVGAAAADGLPAANGSPKARPPRPKKKGGGLGSIVGVVLGGVLSIPIVIGILWAMGRLPDFSRVGRRSGGAAPRAVASTMPDVQPRSLDSLAAEQPADGQLADGQTKPAVPPAPSDNPAAPMASGDSVAAVVEDAVPAAALRAAGDTPAGEPTVAETVDGPAQPAPSATEPAMVDAPAQPGKPDAGLPDTALLATAVPEPIALDAGVLAAVTPAMPAAAAGPGPAPTGAASADPFQDATEDAVAAVAAAVAVRVDPEPLDTLAVEEASEAARAALDDLLAVAPDDPGRKVRLRDWYIAVARVGEEAARLEGVAIERGVPLGGGLASAERVIADMVADETVAADLARVASIWMRAKARPSDGIVFPAVMPEDESRSVGPWWITKLRAPEDPAAELTVIGRDKPTASAGETVVVMGVILDGGVVWATECRSLAADEADAAIDELFGDAAGASAKPAGSTPPGRMPAGDPPATEPLPAQPDSAPAPESPADPKPPADEPLQKTASEPADKPEPEPAPEPSGKPKPTEEPAAPSDSDAADPFDDPFGA
jgi:hypothetical protein